MFARKRLIALGVASAVGVLAAVALGQEVVPIGINPMVKVSPDKAGTPSHPRGIEIDVRGTFDVPSEAVAPMPRSVDVWFPKGWVYNGAKYPACTLAALNTGGPSACPPRSIMSHGTFGDTDPNDLSPPPRVMIINGGRTKMYFWVVIQNPARVQAAAPGTIAKLDSPRWSYRLHADIPGSLHVVAGIPIVMDTFRVHVRRSDWIATTRCPRDHRWRYHLKLTYTSGPSVETGGSIACRS